jgi:hypothetical protein
MSRRVFLASVAAALVVGGLAVPAVAAQAGDPTTVCVLTKYDPDTGSREGVCVWVPVSPPLSGVAAGG